MYGISQGIARARGLFLTMGGGVAISANAGAPTSGTSGTYKGTFRAMPGSLVIDTSNMKLYINTNTKASPTWTVVGTQT